MLSKIINESLKGLIEGYIINGRITDLKNAISTDDGKKVLLYDRFYSRTCLQLAVLRLELDAVKAILENEAGKQTINYKDEKGQTALDITDHFNDQYGDLRDEIRGILEDAGAKRAKDLKELKPIKSQTFSSTKIACNILLCTAALGLGLYVFRNTALISNLGDFASKCLSQLTDCVMSR